MENLYSTMTIWEAAQACIDNVGEQAVDVLALVVDVQRPELWATFSRRGCGPTSRPRRSMVRLWVQDESAQVWLPHGRVWVSLPADHHNSSRMPLPRIGDVVKFHSITLRRPPGGLPTAQASNLKHEQVSSSTVQFHRAWKTPDHRPAFRILGHVDPTLGGWVPAQDRLHQEDRTRPDFTDQRLLENLVSWYQNSDQGQHSAQNRLLTPLPTQRRSIQQLSTAIGQISHVLARIMRYEGPAAGTRRPGFALDGPPPHNLTPSYALLEDGTGSIVFLDQTSRFRDVMQLLTSTTGPPPLVQFSHVCTHRIHRHENGKAHHPRAEWGGHDGFVLQPTWPTTVTRAPPNVRILASQPGDDGYSWSPSILQRDFPSDRETTQSEVLSAHSRARPENRPNHSVGTISLRACLNDIVIDNVSFRQEAGDWSPHRLNRLFQNEEDPTVYSNQAILKLNVHPRDGSFHHSLDKDADPDANTTRSVHAASHVLQTLCASLDLEEWSILGQHARINGGGGQASEMGHRVRNFIKGLLTEKMELYWVLEPCIIEANSFPETRRWRVVSVSLPVL